MVSPLPGQVGDLLHDLAAYSTHLVAPPPSHPEEVFQAGLQGIMCGTGRPQLDMEARPV